MFASFSVASAPVISAPSDVQWIGRLVNAEQNAHPLSDVVPKKCKYLHTPPDQAKMTLLEKILWKYVFGVRAQ